MHSDKQVFRKVLSCCQYDFFLCLFFTPLAWFNSHHCMCFFKVQIEREWRSAFIFYVTVGSPLNVCKAGHISTLVFFRLLLSSPLLIVTLWALMTVFFISLQMLDYKGLYFVELKPISDHCEKLAASREPWGSPLTQAAPESMRQTTNRRYHCTLQTTKTSSVREGNNNPRFSIDFSTTAWAKAQQLRKLEMKQDCTKFVSPFIWHQSYLFS